MTLFQTLWYLGSRTTSTHSKTMKFPNDPKKEGQPSSPPVTVPKRPNFLDMNSEAGQFFELSRSMSAPPAEFLSSIQNVMNDSFMYSKYLFGS